MWNRHLKGREKETVFHYKDSVSRRSNLWDSSFIIKTVLIIINNGKWESAAKKAHCSSLEKCCTKVQAFQSF